MTFLQYRLQYRLHFSENCLEFGSMEILLLMATKVKLEGGVSPNIPAITYIKPHIPAIAHVKPLVMKEVSTRDGNDENETYPPLEIALPDRYHLCIDERGLFCAAMPTGKMDGMGQVEVQIFPSTAEPEPTIIENDFFPKNKEMGFIEFYSNRGDGTPLILVHTQYGFFGCALLEK